MDDRESLKASLLAGYEKIYSRQGTPTWAFDRIAPAIPYIGERFTAMAKKVLIYASAENLSSDNTNRTKLQTHSVHEQLLRSYTAKVLPKEDQNIHIEPINNGGLLKVAQHVLCKVDCGVSIEQGSSREFLSQVAAANPGKFSIDPDKPPLVRKKKNYDYANQPDKFKDQSLFIACDIEKIEPEVVIMPTSIHASFRDAGMEHLLDAVGKLILIKQVQFQAIYGRGKRRQPSQSEWSRPDGYGEWRSPFYADAYVQWITENITKRNTKSRIVIL